MIATPERLPDAWFTPPGLTRPTPLVVTDAGHIYGHAATWDTEHIAKPGQFPPRSGGSAGGGGQHHQYFLTGAVLTDAGRTVQTGQLTLSGGHAWPLSGDPLTAALQYDATRSGIADITVGEDAHGIWVTGGLRPGITPAQVRTLKASAPSGDWRPINGKLELLGICMVNVPGFMVTRVRIPISQPEALAASGYLPPTALLARFTELERRLVALGA